MAPDGPNWNFVASTGTGVLICSAGIPSEYSCIPPGAAEGDGHAGLGGNGIDEWLLSQPCCAQAQQACAPQDQRARVQQAEAAQRRERECHGSNNEDELVCYRRPPLLRIML